MLKYFLATLGILASLNSFAEGRITLIEEAIKELSPGVSEVDRRYQAGFIDRYSREYDVEWEVAVVIFKQESNFDIRAVNYKSRDFGIGQMHYKTIENRNLDLGLILTDRRYATEETFKLLSELKTKYDKIDKRKGRKWFTRYHSFTIEFREEYAERLEKHLRTIKRFIDDGRQRQEKRKIHTRGSQKNERGVPQRKTSVSDSEGERWDNRSIDAVQTGSRRELEGREEAP